MTIKKYNALDMDNIITKRITAVVDTVGKYVIVRFGTDVAIMGRLKDIKSTVVLVQFDNMRMSISRSVYNVI